MDKFDEKNNGLSGFPMLIAGIPAEYATVAFDYPAIPVQQETKQ